MPEEDRTKNYRDNGSPSSSSWSDFIPVTVAPMKHISINIDRFQL